MTSIWEKLFGVVLLISLVCFGFVIGSYVIPMYENQTQDNLFSDNEYLSDRYSVNSVNYDGEMTMGDIQQGIVTIYAKTNNGEDVESQGSGFMYTDKHIMTNSHVISGTSEYYIQYQNGDWASAEFVGSDSDTDIAILKPDSVPTEVNVLPMQSHIPSVGESVVAIGSPAGLEQSITTGVVSSNKVLMDIETNHPIPDSIQTDAALNPGNSGGPLISKSDKAVIGVNRATLGENIGFAISSRVAHNVGQDLIERGGHEHSYIGIDAKTLNPDSDMYDSVNINSGLIVSNITKDGPSDNKNIYAEDDGFSSPDILIRVDGIDMNTKEDLDSYVSLRTEPSDEIELELYRDGEIITKNVKVEHRIKYY